MTTEVTYREFDEIIRSIGFDRQKSKSGTRVYRHETSGALVILPDLDDTDPIPQRHMVGTRMILDAYGIMEPPEFASRFHYVG